MFVAAAFLAASVQAQDLKISLNKKGKVGFVDSQGNVVVKCIYDSATPFEKGISIVTKSGKSGIIDASGKVLLPLKYTQIYPWANGLYLVKNGKKMGLAKSNGQIALDVKYSHISKINCYGKALVALGGKNATVEKKNYMANAKYGIINNEGRLLVEPKYKGLYEFAYDGSQSKVYHEGKCLLHSYHFITDTLQTDCSYLGYSSNPIGDNKAGILDGNGKVLLKSGSYNFVMRPEGGMVRYYNVKSRETKCGYHNLSTGKGFEVAKFNKHLSNIDFWTHGDFTGDIAPVNGDAWKFIDKKGNVLRSNYKALRHTRNLGLWAAKDSDGKWSVFDESNNDIAALSGYTDMLFPQQKDDKEIFTVQKDGAKYGCINRSGETVVPFDYEDAWDNRFDAVCVKKDGKWGAVAPNGSVIVPTEYMNVIFPSERGANDYWVQKSDSLYYHYNVAKKKLSKNAYKDVANFMNGVALVRPADMKLEDNQVNRAQTYAPNTDNATLGAVNLDNMLGAFGYLLAADDVVIFDRPVSTLYKDAVLKKIAELGHRVPTDQEKKNILLEVTRENRSYNLDKTLGEEEWNY